MSVWEPIPLTKRQRAKQNRKTKKAPKHREGFLGRAERDEAMLEEAFDLANSARISLASSRVKGGRRAFLHVMLNDEQGRRLLNWYPSSKTYWCPLDNSKGECPDADTAIWLADQKRGNP